MLKSVSIDLPNSLSQAKSLCNETTVPQLYLYFPVRGDTLCTSIASAEKSK